MLKIYAVTITIERTRLHPRLTFRWRNIWVAIQSSQHCLIFPATIDNLFASNAYHAEMQQQGLGGKLYNESLGILTSFRPPICSTR